MTASLNSQPFTMKIGEKKKKKKKKWPRYQLRRGVWGESL